MSKRVQSGRTSFETILIIVMISIFLIISVNKFMSNVLVAKESLLRSELTNIRMSIELYRLLNGKYPISLSELTKSEYMQPYSNDTVIKNQVVSKGMIKNKYLQTHSVDEDGQPLDPFDKRYYYNKDTGEIKSLTKGYDSW